MTRYVKIGQKLVPRDDGLGYKILDRGPDGFTVYDEQAGISKEYPLVDVRPRTRKKSSGLGNLVRAGVVLASLTAASLGVNELVKGGYLTPQQNVEAEQTIIAEEKQTEPQRLILAGVFGDYSTVEKIVDDFADRGYETRTEKITRDGSDLTRLYVDVSDGWLEQKEVLRRLAKVHGVDDAQEWEFAEGEYRQVTLNEIMREALDRYVGDTSFNTRGEAMIDIARILPEMVRQESSYDRKAKSNKGALGYLQVLPPTSEDIEERIRSLPEFENYREMTGDKKWRPDLPRSDYEKYLYNATLNLDDGVAYAWHLYNKFEGDPEKWVAAYNAGPGNYNKNFPETVNYRRTILSRSESYGETHLASLGLGD